MRAIWKGAVAFGLVNVPVKLYSATGQHEVSLHQVHREDAGRVRYKRVCSVCGNELTMADIDKGYETADGSMVVLTDEDLASLPLATEREISVLEFVPGEQVDPILLDRTYYLEPERTAAKAYTLLREALETSDRMAVVKVALRQRESMAVLRVRGDVIVLQTLLWPDEVRDAEFPVLDADVTVRPQELAMASSLIESMAGDFDPSEFEDSYATALEQMIEAKIESGSTVTPSVQEEEAEPAAAGGEVVDLLAALQRSVESARARSVPAADAEDAEEAKATGTTGKATGTMGKATSGGKGTSGGKAGSGGSAGSGGKATSGGRTTDGGKAGTPSGAGKSRGKRVGGKDADDAASDEGASGDGADDKPAKATGARKTTARAAGAKASRSADVPAATEAEEAPKKAAARRRAS